MDDAGLKFRFHNPNTEEETEKYILKVFIDANGSKVERAVNEAKRRAAAEAEVLS
ncbi:MAG: hypothetical protein J1E35_10250 [Lachnospiraceae bacterium]|nr:hypothetical protein [Lachnospiraceae bacterium]